MHGQENLPSVCAQSRATYGVSGYESSEFIWFIENGEIISGAGTDTVTVQWGYNTGEYRLEVLERTISGCTNVPSIALVEVKAPDVNLGFDFVEFCDQDSFTFDATGRYVEPFEIEWFNGSSEPTYTTYTSEMIWVKVTDGDQCVRYDTVAVTVHPLPVVYIGRDTALCDINEPLQVDAGDYMFYDWRSEQGNYTYNPVYIYPPEELTDTIILYATDYNNCTSSDTMVIIPCDVDKLFAEMPNTITPDGDGQNDTWKIPYVNLFPEAELEVFDRWGRLVYRSTKVYEEPWDGKSKGKTLPMDSYYFVLKLNFQNAKPVVGTVNIIQ